MVDINRRVFSVNRDQEERHAQELAQKMGLPYINLSNYPIAPEVLSIIPEEVAVEYQFIPYLKVGSELKIGMPNVNNERTKKFLEEFTVETKLTFQPALISKSSYIYGLFAYEKKKDAERTKTESAQKEREDSFQDQISDLATAAEVARKVTTTKLLDVIIMGAVKTKASDIHLEPGEEEFLIRFRIDGVLQDVVRLPKAQFAGLLSRIKFLAHIRMDQSIQPQDGRFSFRTLDDEIDLRISTMPSSGGETVVMRLLGRNQNAVTLEALGFRPDALTVIRSAISRPHGLILTSGPTGSGKTSTLYAMLSEINKPERKIITLEDPIEYRIQGIEQSQIDKANNYNFADGLKAALRQDPDVIMVGEIRDVETAEIAIQAGLTGHLVLSTVHANSAPSVFARLLDIGVKPFLLSGSINLVMAQRLVRRLCPKCAEAYTPDQAAWSEIKSVLEPIKEMLPPQIAERLNAAEPKLRREKGCPECNSTGYKGRLAVLEVFIPDENIANLIRNHAGILEFEKAARAQGMISMEQDGLMKVLLGETPVDEVWRVTKE